RRLAAAGWTDESRDLVAIERQRHRLQRLGLAVEELQVLDRHLFRQVVRIGRRVGDGDGGDTRSDIHEVFLWAARMRAMMLSASTVTVMMSAPVQASFCQSL